MEFLDVLKTSDVITIGTVASSGRVINTPVGVVVVGDAGYVRSQRRAKSKWYRRAIQTPRGFVIDGDLRYPVSLQHITDNDTIRSVNEATHRKYGGPLRSLVLKPLLWKTRDYVLRISPGEVRDAGRDAYR